MKLPPKSSVPDVSLKAWQTMVSKEMGVSVLLARATERALGDAKVEVFVRKGGCEGGWYGGFLPEASKRVPKGRVSTKG